MPSIRKPASKTISSAFEKLNGNCTSIEWDKCRSPKMHKTPHEVDFEASRLLQNQSLVSIIVVLCFSHMTTRTSVVALLSQQISVQLRAPCFQKKCFVSFRFRVCQFRSRIEPKKLSRLETKIRSFFVPTILVKTNFHNFHV